MKILHIMLSRFYVEGLGYQENILPQYHQQMGHDVHILTSTFFNSYLGDKRYLDLDEYTNEFSIHVKKLKRERKYLFRKELPINEYVDVYNAIEAVSPDCIFIHGLTTVADLDIAKYLRKHPNVIAYADQHGDYYNCKVDTVKSKMIVSMFWNPIIHILARHVRMFWGTTPWRCQYLKDVYRLPEEKIKLLVMGGDDRYIHFDQMPELRFKVREQLDLNEDDFVIITGGKIDKAKNIHLLMRAVIELNKDDLKLIVFGQPDEEMEKEIAVLSRDSHIRNIGWLDSTKVYDYFLASDLVVFPGTHSVLWEQACACGLPGIYKRWDGMQHVDLGGNAVFLDEWTIDGIRDIIKGIYDNREKYDMMKRIATEKCIKEFSYKSIAKRAIGLDDHMPE